MPQNPNFDGIQHLTFQLRCHSCSRHSSLLECAQSACRRPMYLIPIQLSNAWRSFSQVVTHCVGALGCEKVGQVVVGLTDGNAVLHSKTSEAQYLQPSIIQPLLYLSSILHTFVVPFVPSDESACASLPRTPQFSMSVQRVSFEFGSIRARQSTGQIRGQSY